MAPDIVSWRDMQNRSYLRRMGRYLEPLRGRVTNVGGSRFEFDPTAYIRNFEQELEINSNPPDRLYRDAHFDYLGQSLEGGDAQTVAELAQKLQQRNAMQQKIQRLIRVADSAGDRSSRMRNGPAVATAERELAAIRPRFNELLQEIESLEAEVHDAAQAAFVKDAMTNPQLTVPATSQTKAPSRPQT